MTWKKAKKNLPICYETGDWDGKRSDLFLCQDTEGENYLARCYEFDEDHVVWYDKNDNGLNYEIVLWCEIPGYFKHPESATNSDVKFKPWYTKDEIKTFLIHNKYSERIANELASMFSNHLNIAYKKGLDHGFKKKLKEWTPNREIR